MYLPPTSLRGDEGGTDTDYEIFVTLGGKINNFSYWPTWGSCNVLKITTGRGFDAA